VSFLKKHNFLIRKVHSLLGIVPVGVFFIEHLITNSFAMHGPDVYNAKVEWIHQLPYVFWLEVFGIFLPIMAHVGLGFVFLWAWKDNSSQYRYARNWMYTAQRVTGIIGFFFICYHMYDFRFRELFTGDVTHISFKTVAESLETAWVYWFYVLGMVAICYHFANGIWSFMVHWGLIIGPKAQRIAGIICLAAGVTFAYIGIDSLNSFTQVEALNGDGHQKVGHEHKH
jgi:succinate dehydrogenase / fumarate reductase, cytochrome b subunit